MDTTFNTPLPNLIITLHYYKMMLVTKTTELEMVAVDLKKHLHQHSNLQIQAIMAARFPKEKG